MSLKEFYEFYDMIENYDILISGKSWDTINITDAMSLSREPSKEKENSLPPDLRQSKSMENKPANTPDEENICVICFDKNIKVILKDCYVKLNFLTKSNKIL